MDLVNFPSGFPEEERIKICKMLEEKDNEIKQVYKDIIILENKIERFNGGLNYKEAENLRTQMGINNAIVEQIYAGLKKFNLRSIQYDDPKSPHVFTIKIEKIPLLERFSSWLKSLIKYDLVRKSN